MGTTPGGTAEYKRFVADLLGAMAYGELSAFELLSVDARYSPTLHDRAVLGRIAVAGFGHYELVSERLSAMGIDVEDAMLPFRPSVDHFHERTRPGDWFESLMKAYVIDTVASDFYRAISVLLDHETKELVERIQSSDAATPVLRELLKKALADDPRLASRLSLWSRRLLGEVLTQAQRVRLDHDVLAGLEPNGLRSGEGGTAGGGGDSVAAALGGLTAPLAEQHAKRMADLGLTA